MTQPERAREHSGQRPHRPSYPRTNFLYAMRCGWSASAASGPPCTLVVPLRVVDLDGCWGLTTGGFRGEYEWMAHARYVLYDVSCQRSLDTMGGDFGQALDQRCRQVGGIADYYYVVSLNGAGSARTSDSTPVTRCPVASRPKRNAARAPWARELVSPMICRPGDSLVTAVLVRRDQRASE